MIQCKFKSLLYYYYLMSVHFIVIKVFKKKVNTNKVEIICMYINILYIKKKREYSRLEGFEMKRYLNYLIF